MPAYDGNRFEPPAPVARKKPENYFAESAGIVRRVKGQLFDWDPAAARGLPRSLDRYLGRFRLSVIV